MPRIWHPDRRQLAGAVKSRQGKGIPAIGLDVKTLLRIIT
jgi:hypothetical protein